jgi:hypothetical protein
MTWRTSVGGSTTEARCELGRRHRDRLMWLAIGAGVLLWCAWDVFARMLDWLDDEEDD